MSKITQELFNRWYKSVDLENNEERTDKRWEGVNAVAQDVDDEDIEGLVRIAFASRQKPEPETIEKIREIFLSSDDSFEHGNSREMQILAGASLAVIMDRDDDLASKTALSLTTALLGGGRAPDLPMNLGDMAENRIYEIGLLRRKRNSISSPKSPSFSTENIDKVSSTNAVPATAAAISSEVQSSLVSMSKSYNQVIRKLTNRMRVQDEELQMLWWLIGEFSNTLNINFNKISENAKPIVFGQELADATELLPGPCSIRALLSRSGLRDDGEILISEAVNKLPAELFENYELELGKISSVTCPIHYAIARQRETGNGDAWVAGWEAATEIKSGHKLGMITLGNLFYRECLLMLF